MTPGRTCEPCSATGFTITSLFILLAIIAGLTLIGGAVGKYWHRVPGKHLVRCAFVPFRILVIYAQVVTQLGDVLAFPYSIRRSSTRSSTPFGPSLMSGVYSSGYLDCPQSVSASLGLAAGGSCAS